MKIIFLDIDGVLNSRAYDRKRNWNEQTDIDETRLPLIKEIVDATNAKIVLSSTWREHWDREPNRCKEDGRYINKFFAKYGPYMTRRRISVLVPCEGTRYRNG